MILNIQIQFPKISYCRKVPLFAIYIIYIDILYIIMLLKALTETSYLFINSCHNHIALNYLSLKRVV